MTSLLEYTTKRTIKGYFCPVCGREVFTPIEHFQKFKDGTPVPVENPVVWCRDMGHWCGQLSDCRKV